MEIKKFDFANLTSEQESMLKNFEKEFNSKFGKELYVLAFNKK